MTYPAMMRPKSAAPDLPPRMLRKMKLEYAQRLLGHSKEQMTKAVYRRIGERVRPTK